MTNKERHYKLWDELARTGEEQKQPAFHRVFGEDIKMPADCCFACQECDERGGDVCTECPLTPNIKGNCLDGLFDRWCDANDREERKRLAALIRDLPWREKDHA